MQEMIIVNPGMQSTIQDLGRWGYQNLGYSVDGAMDSFALRAANMLVGNDTGEAAIEMTMMGMEVYFTTDAIIAVTGADMKPCIGKEPVSMWASHTVKAGEHLKLGVASVGMRAYLAVRGGFALEPFLGSCSTGIQEKTGHNGGSPLKKDEHLTLKRPHHSVFLQRTFSADCIPSYYRQNAKEIRVIGGPFEDSFTQKGLDTFYHTPFKVGNDVNRVGYRLEGIPIEQRVSKGKLISLSMATGSIQVPGGGNPIILCVERRTHGGYPVIATVTSTDMARVAQCRPGDTIRFRKIPLWEAHQNLIAEHHLLEEKGALENSLTIMKTLREQQ